MDWNVYGLCQYTPNILTKTEVASQCYYQHGVLKWPPPIDHLFEAFLQTELGRFY